MMKKGFYVRLAANNIRKNGKLYIPYLFTCVLSVVMFYVMMSLSLDPAVKKMFAGGTLSLIMRYGTVIVGIFVFAFLMYSNAFLMKRRQPGNLEYLISSEWKNSIWDMCFFWKL